jgi:hypothetical protein
MKNTFTASMNSGPQLFSFRDGIYFYGAYHVLTFTEQDQGKELRVTVDTDKPVCWVELWPAVYDGKDWVRWATERGQDALALSGGGHPEINPSITWKIQPGNYTLYFVNSSRTKKVSEELITFKIEVN